MAASAGDGAEAPGGTTPTPRPDSAPSDDAADAAVASFPRDRALVADGADAAPARWTRAWRSPWGEAADAADDEEASA